MEPANRRPSLPRSSFDDPVALAAGEWVVRQDAGLTSDDRAAFDRWLQESPRNAEVYAEVKWMWKALDRMPASARAAQRATRNGPWALPRAIALMAAAAVVFGAIVLQPTSPGRYHTIAATEPGGWQRLDLPDGTMIQLNGASEIDVDFRRERRARLVRGQAFFAVAKDATRPFVVRVGTVDVRAVGTAFDVKLAGSTVDVLVTEGRVRVEDAARGLSGRGVVAPPRPATATERPLTSSRSAEESAVLSAGQRAVIELRAADMPVMRTITALSPEETSVAVAWQNRRLTFDAAPLSKLVSEFNRHNRHQIVITDPRLAARRFGGTFPAGDTANLIHLLETDFGVIAERGADETRLRLP